MFRGSALLLVTLAALVIFFTSIACASGLEPVVGTSEHIGGIVYYYQNGSVSYGNASGMITVSNPSLLSPLSAVNLTAMDGSTVFVDRIDPSSAYSMNYTIGHGSIEIPLKLKETIIPSSLYSGSQQQVRLVVEVQNTGAGDITCFEYQKALPQGLDEAWAAYDCGTLSVNDTVTWSVGDLGPGEKTNLTVAFSLAPSSGLYFPGAYIRYVYGSSLTGNDPAFSGITSMSFKIQKSNPEAGLWYVDASVPDDGEFNVDLKSVSLYRSDASDPYNTSLLETYSPDLSLSPGDAWEASLADHFSQVPAYFIKLSYSLPYTLKQEATLEYPARTEPVNITVSAPPPSPTPQPTSSHVLPLPTVTPSPSPVPPESPDIMFVDPSDGAVIKDNVTTIEASVPPSSDPGYAVYYGSTDNKTWVKLGDSSVIGNLSELIWQVPQINGTYYLKAEHYNREGLKGTAYVHVLLVHQTLPLNVITILKNSINWLMLLGMIAVILILLLMALPLIRGKPAIYDYSALYALSRDDRDWRSKLPGRTIRPDSAIFDVPGAEQIKAKAVRETEESKRLEREYGLSPYDAMSIQLARETGATLFTSDARIKGICEILNIKAMTPGKNK